MWERQSYVPSWSTVIGLSNVVVAFSVAAHKEDFVVDIRPTSLVESMDVVLEPLPLGE